MLLDSPAVERLVDALRRLPGVGKRSAERLALHLLAEAPEAAFELSDAMRQARERITACAVCCNLTETDPCPVCTDTRRDSRLLCVVERPAAAMAIERGGAFRGRYHVLNGVLNPLEGIGPSELQLDRLFRRLDGGEIEEVIIATNTTAEGEATALYLARQMRERGVQVTRIAHGVPMGGGLDYADDATLSHAIQGRVGI